MSGGWTVRRFWNSAGAVEVPGGFAVALDGRKVRTPAKTLLVVPTAALAEAIAAEWNAQDGAVDPGAMPLTRAANSALDKVTPLFDAVVDEIAGYGATDLLCYRGLEPVALIARQAEGWDPLIRWADTALGAPLAVTSGVVHIAQPGPSLARLRGIVARTAPFPLTALHDLVALSGSLVLGLAVTQGNLAPEEAWNLSRIDEDWQIDQWGEDEEAAEMATRKRLAFLDSFRFHQLSTADR